MSKVSDIANVVSFELKYQSAGHGVTPDQQTVLLNTNASASHTGTAELFVNLIVQDKNGHNLDLGYELIDYIWLRFPSAGTFKDISYHKFGSKINRSSSENLLYTARWEDNLGRDNFVTYEITATTHASNSSIFAELRLPNGVIKRSNSLLISTADYGPDRKVLPRADGDLQPQAETGYLKVTIGKLYSINLTASGGKAPYYYYMQPDIPYEESFWADPGKLKVRAKAPGKYSFWIGARDDEKFGAQDRERFVLEAGMNGWRQYEIEGVPANILVTFTQTPPNCMVGDKYPNIEIVASGGTEPYSYKAEGDVPPGLAVDGAVFSGTPTKYGDYEFRLVGTDSYGNTGHRDCHVTIFPKLNGEFDGDEHATVGVEYKGKVYSSGGYPPVRLEMELPEGLTLQPYVEERDPRKDHSRARVVGKPTKAVVDFPMKPYAIDSKGNRAALLAEPDKLTVAPGKPGGADLALGKLLRGHFALASGSGGETLTITGEVSGGGLSESNRPAFVFLQIKQPGQSTFVDAKTIGKLEWATNWKADGWEFTLSGIKWSAQKGVPRFEIQAKLDSHTSKSAIVRFPLSEFVKNLAFQDSDGEPLSGTQLTVKPGPQTLHLHMAFYNAIDQLTAKLALPDGITGKALSPAVIAALPKSLKVRSDWNGHTQPVLFEISKENPLKIASGSHQTVNLSIPVDVATTFRSGEAKCELSSSSESVENVPNDTKPERTALSLLASTS